MAASPHDEMATPNPLNPTGGENPLPPLNGHDSAPQPDLRTPSDRNAAAAAAAAADGDDAVSGQKRKREAEGDGSDHPPLPPLWKTSLCSYFRRDSGSCSHGAECRYAHGEEELRLRPDNTWDPTSEKAKKASRAASGDRRDGASESAKEDVLMTEMVADDDGGDGELSKCIVHLPRKWSSDQLRKFLDEQGVVHKSAKKKKGMVVGFVTFEDVEQLKSAIEGLEGKSIGSKNIKIADVLPRSFENKAKQGVVVPQRGSLNDESEEISVSDGLRNDCSDNNTPALGGSSTRARSARDVVTPLAHMSYVDQLVHKVNALMQMLKRLTRNARKACPSGVSLPDWILKSKERGGLPCELEGIMESPLTDGYRNKCEFSVGYSLQGKPTVGFMLGNYREGVTAVEEPIDCPNVSRIACKYASILQDFLQCSGFPIWNRFNNTGFWRQLTVREGRTNRKSCESENSESCIAEVMLIIQVCSVGLDNAIVSSEFERLVQAFVAGAAESAPSMPLTAVVVQDHQGISNAAPADASLRLLPIPQPNNGASAESTKDGKEARIHDYISNLQFCISPTAFFQVNTLAAEKLYSLAGDWAGLDQDTLLFDVCCGTGTIGLTLAHRVGMVVGIEMNASAVLDAQRNAEINGIRNCKFVCAKAEDVMGSLLKEYLHAITQNLDEVTSASQSHEETISAESEGAVANKTLETENGSNNCPEINQEASGSSGIKEQVSECPEEKSSTSGSGSTPAQQFKKVVAIVDPPRVGLHPIVIKALRTHSHLRKLVYISCNPESLVANAIELCTPSPENNEKGKKDNRAWRNMSSAGLARHRVKSMPNSEPFHPVKAMAVDLFPHTPHCELVMLLER
ncbi:zinc finger CCCH domain-containing protein 24 [Syzygium oleosum]|uniref:zinc finger CCCH domain-containing protein 24 n=1 Tax=Syzygium oleosum TaxID=219896 RepID=UPI0011D2238F|nr:zinc finger CCCH domain-containing protein 24 [Syzygium oleosum]